MRARDTRSGVFGADAPRLVRRTGGAMMADADPERPVAASLAPLDVRRVQRPMPRVSARDRSPGVPDSGPTMPPASAAACVLEMQRTAGNRAVAQVLARTPGATVTTTPPCPARGRHPACGDNDRKFPQPLLRRVQGA